MNKITCSQIGNIKVSTVLGNGFSWTCYWFKNDQHIMERSSYAMFHLGYLTQFYALSLGILQFPQ